MIKEEKKYTYGNRLKYHFAAFLSFFSRWRLNDTFLASWYAMMTLDRENKGSSYFVRVRKTTSEKRREQKWYEKK